MPLPVDHGVPGEGDALRLMQIDDQIVHSVLEVAQLGPMLVLGVVEVTGSSLGQVRLLLLGHVSRSCKALSTASGTRPPMDPPSLATSLTREDEMKLQSDLVAMNTVSIPVRWRFICDICISYS
jgi:hypothetical protein